MVERFTSAAIELPPRERPFERADLLFYGLDHSGPSFEARVFVDPRAVSREADSTHRAYAGKFFIFGHGGCFGESQRTGRRDPRAAAGRRAHERAGLLHRRVGNSEPYRRPHTVRDGKHGARRDLGVLQPARRSLRNR